jgi:hypothetical protein
MLFQALIHPVSADVLLDGCNLIGAGGRIWDFILPWVSEMRWGGLLLIAVFFDDSSGENGGGKCRRATVRA